MAEFGEQLKKAREQKGMTQQSLAQKLYVTRQTVSRWEGGERYPDLLTVKKIAQILEVRTDFLFLDEDSELIMNKSSMVDHPIMNPITLALFSGISMTSLISLLGNILKLPVIMKDITGLDILVCSFNLVSGVIGVVAFTLGLNWILKGIFSYKKVGFVLESFFVASLISQLGIVFAQVNGSYWMVITLVIFNIIGVLVSFIYYQRQQSSNIWYYLMMAICMLGFIKGFYTFFTTVLFGSHYVSLHTALNVVCTTCIYVLFSYLTHRVFIQRKLNREMKN